MTESPGRSRSVPGRAAEPSISAASSEHSAAAARHKRHQSHTSTTSAAASNAPRATRSRSKPHRSSTHTGTVPPTATSRSSSLQRIPSCKPEPPATASSHQASVVPPSDTGGVLVGGGSGQQQHHKPAHPQQYAQSRSRSSGSDTPQQGAATATNECTTNSSWDVITAPHINLLPVPEIQRVPVPGVFSALLCISCRPAAGGGAAGGVFTCHVTCHVTCRHRRLQCEGTAASAATIAGAFFLGCARNYCVVGPCAHSACHVSDHLVCCTNLLIGARPIRTRGGTNRRHAWSGYRWLCTPA